MYTIATIEDAIIARLTSQLTYLVTCASMGEGLVDEAEDITIRFPAAYVVYERGEYDHSTGGVQDRRMDFSVIVGAKNVRGDVAARHGLGSEKGVYEMLDDVRSALTENACGLNIDPLMPAEEEVIETTKDMALYSIRFQTRCRFSI